MRCRTCGHYYSHRAMVCPRCHRFGSLMNTSGILVQPWEYQDGDRVELTMETEITGVSGVVDKSFPAGVQGVIVKVLMDDPDWTDELYSHVLFAPDCEPETVCLLEPQHVRRVIVELVKEPEKTK